MGKPFAVIVVAAVLAAGCGRGPEPMALEEYRDAVVAASTTHRGQVDAFQATFERELPLLIKRLERDLEVGDAGSEAAYARGALDETKNATANLLAKVGDADARYRDALDRLVPPTELADAHEALVGALDVAVAGLAGTLDAITKADSFPALDAALGGSVYTDAQPRVVAACETLQQQLRDLGLGGDLGCRRAVGVAEPAP